VRDPRAWLRGRRGVSAGRRKREQAGGGIAHDRLVALRGRRTRCGLGGDGRSRRRGRKAGGWRGRWWGLWIVGTRRCVFCSSILHPSLLRPPCPFLPNTQPHPQVQESALLALAALVKDSPTLAGVLERPLSAGMGKVRCSELPLPLPLPPLTDTGPLGSRPALEGYCGRSGRGTRGDAPRCGVGAYQGAGGRGAGGGVFVVSVVGFCFCFFFGFGGFLLCGLSVCFPSVWFCVLRFFFLLTLYGFSFEWFTTPFRRTGLSRLLREVLRSSVGRAYCCYRRLVLGEVS
jgi:hypothetical protein